MLLPAGANSSIKYWQACPTKLRPAKAFLVT